MSGSNDQVFGVTSVTRLKIGNETYLKHGTDSFSGVVNDIILQLPNSSDILVGRDTTDTLTNKTISDGVINSTGISITPNDNNISTINTLYNRQGTLFWINKDGTSQNLAAGDSGMSALVDDSTPELGGHLDVKDKIITSSSGGNIVFAPNTTGDILLKGNGGANSFTKIDGTTGFLQWKAPYGTTNALPSASDYEGMFAFVSGTGMSYFSKGTSGWNTIVDISSTQTIDAKTLTNSTLTTPKINTGLKDANGNAILNLTGTSSADNYLTITNSNASSPSLEASGDSTNIDITLTPKGAGGILLSQTTAPGTTTNKLYNVGGNLYWGSNQIIRSLTLSGDSGVSETLNHGSTLSIIGGTGIDTVVSSADTITLNVDNTVTTLTGTQTLTNKTLDSPKISSSLLDSNGNVILNFTGASSANNYLNITNSNGSSPSVAANGNSANIDITLTPKNAAGVLLSTSSSAPGTTTNKLYNLSGDLYWNGTNMSLIANSGGMSYYILKDHSGNQQTISNANTVVINGENGIETSLSTNGNIKTLKVGISSSETLSLDGPIGGTNLITNINLTGASDQNIASTQAIKSYVDSAAFSSGTPSFNFKSSVVVASIENIDLTTECENGDNIDGVTLTTGDRILIKNQTLGTQNGIYTVNASGAPTRASDIDSSDELVSGILVFIEGGNTHADQTFVLITADPITVDSTPLTFSQFSKSNVNGSELVGTTLASNITNANLTTVTSDYLFCDGKAGTQNLVYGYQAGNSLNTNTVGNTLIGYQSGDVLTWTQNNTIDSVSVANASYNTLVGNLAGTSMNTGYGNVLVGSETGKDITSGSKNVLVGFQAGLSQTTTDNNINIGWKSGKTNTKADNNILMGSYSGYTLDNTNESGSVKSLTISNGGSGYSSAFNVSTSGGNGTGFTLDITTTGGSISGTTINSNGSGYLVGDVLSISGGTDGTITVSTINKHGSNNIILGNQSGYSCSTGYQNLVLGSDSGYYLSTGYQNVFLGG